MSSGNKLSISICDDNGNLMYSQNYRVRKIIKQGVIRDAEKWVIADVLDDSGTSGYQHGTRKWILVLEYDSCYSEPVSVYMPCCSQLSDTELSTVSKVLLTKEFNTDYMVNALNTQIYNAQGEHQTQKIIYYQEAAPMSQFKYLSVTEDVYYSNEHSVESIVFDVGQNDMTKVRAYYKNMFEGKRWFGILPFERVEDEYIEKGTEYVMKFKVDRRNKFPIKYRIVEVE